MWKSIVAGLLICLSITVSGCSSRVSGLNKYVSTTQGYEFLYPNGWISVNLEGARGVVDVILRDLIDRSQTVSMVISDIPSGKKLTELGTPTEVGYRLLKTAIAPDGSAKKADLLGAEIEESPTQSYYTLEYAVKLPDGRERHNLASVAVSRAKLFTLNVSVPESRWHPLEKQLRTIVDSLSVY